jgi:hypothetical protein
MDFAQKNIKRFKPVHTVLWLFANKTNHKPVQTGSDRFKDFSPRKCHNNVKRKEVQTGSHRFMTLAQQKHKPVQTGSDRFKDFAHENASTT